MQIEVVVSPLSNNVNLIDKKVVVIDILRATSTIIAALANKALEVIPVVEPAEATNLVKKIGPQECIIGGERKGLKIEGFDLGNSPLEYCPEKVAGKKVILCTTNGTKAIKWAQGATEVLIGSFLNLQTIIDYLQNSIQDLVLVCSGRDNDLCLEDLAYAGMMIDQLLTDDVTTMTDSAKLAYYVYEKANKKLDQFIKQTQHGRYLKEIGMEEDILECLNLNKYPILPRYYNGKISLLENTL